MVVARDFLFFAWDDTIWSALYLLLYKNRAGAILSDYVHNGNADFSVIQTRC